jgi:hypothetical protein
VPPLAAGAEVTLAIEASPLRSPQAAGLNSDPRQLGVLVRRVSLE